MKIKHILKTKEFSFLIENGRKLRGETVFLYADVTNTPGESRMSAGVTTSKKYAPRAVTRNYIKRFIYAELRKTTIRKNINIRIIVRLRKYVNNLSRKEIAILIRNDITNLMLQIDGVE